MMYYNIGCTFAKLKNYKEARINLEKALKLRNDEDLKEKEEYYRAPAVFYNR